ncbi:copper chaperone PCu(A)C [Leucobacter viscericola]|uniref:Copper chaperone PCu(A)C n=1 Tax=Leucobacter viscericola TaxID=2714935 RepID=A0A6G7XCR5_9MICO|nr:copper chaperone PCu(A)C [Leucobacter viscericola]QIK62400.1 copper chaperone PCu(A)C [Leucobacter viscericola]
MIRTKRATPLSRTAAILLAAPLLVSVPLLAGCSSEPTKAAESSDTKPASASESAVTLKDGWAKAAEGMSGVFGTLVNSSDKDIVLEKAESPVAKMVQLHETITSGSSSTMRETDGGFVIPKGGSFTLEPGGNHIMFMDMPKALLPGDEVPLTLHFSDGKTLKVTVLAKDYAGAQENYEGDSADNMSTDSMSTEDHGGQDDEHSGH